MNLSINKQFYHYNFLCIQPYTRAYIIYLIQFYRDPRAAILYSWPSAESSMRHARRQTLPPPPLPSTLRELDEYFDINAER